MNLGIRKKHATGISNEFVNGDLARLRDEMDRTFDRFFSDPFALGGIEPKLLRADCWMPAIDVSETDSEMTVWAEVPGIAAKDLDVSVSAGVLTIAGQKEEKSESKNEDYCCCERRFGSFRRSIELPETVDADKISADSDNGVVTIHVPKKPGAAPKQIEITSTPKKVPVG